MKKLVLLLCFISAGFVLLQPESHADQLFGATRIGHANSPALFRINVASGSVQSFATVPNMLQITAMASDDANNIWVIGTVNATWHLGTVDPATGVVTVVTPTSFPFANANSANGLAWHPDFGLYGVGLNNEIISIDATTGIGTQIGPSLTNFAMDSLAFSPSGRLFSWSRSGGLGLGLVEIDPTTGFLRDVGHNNGDASNIHALEFSRDGSVLYGVGEALYEIDIETGIGTEISDGPGMEDIRGVAFVDAVQAVPQSFDVTRGQFVAGTAADLAESDDSDVSARRATSDIQSRVYVDVKSTSPTDLPGCLTITVEASVFARSPVTQSIDLYNYVSNDFEEVGVRFASRFSDSVAVVSVTGDVSRFVQSTTNCMDARIRFESTNPRQQFSANVDQVIWTIE